MEFSNLYVPRSEFKDYRKGLSTQHSYADVVIIDRSPTGAKNQVYQLKSDIFNYDNLSQIRFEFQRLNRDAFIAMGDLLEMKTSDKTILLTNGDTVTYKYLILFNGNEQPIELETSLHALKDALLIEAINVKEKLNKAPVSPYIAPYFAAKSDSQPNSVEKVAQPCMQQQGENNIDLGANARSLCQVQI